VTQGLRTLLDEATARLASAGVTSPEADSWFLASAVLGRGRGELQAALVMGDVELTEGDSALFAQMLRRRVEREPLWHITGTAPFLDCELLVGKGVFVPRPETELVALTAISEAQLMHPSSGELKVVDLCSGSGALAIALSRALPHAQVIAVELSPDAVGFLENNVSKWSPDRVEIIRGDVSVMQDHPWAGVVDVIVSNPPYLVPGEELDQETRDYDPHQALFGGEDGLDVIRRVIEVSAVVLRPGGSMVLEHGIKQGDAISGLLSEAGFAGVSTEKDLVGRDRFTRATKR